LNIYQAELSANILRIAAEGYVDSEAIPCASSIGNKAPSNLLLKTIGKVEIILSIPIRS
jgi:hypothetical protein